MTAALDLAKAALLVVDVQADYLAAEGFLARAGKRPLSDDAVADMSAQIRRLADAFRAKGRPVIWARTAFRADMADCAWGPGWAERQFGAAKGFLVEGAPGAAWAAGFAPGEHDILLTRGAHSVFAGTALDRILANLDARDLLLAGGPLSASLSDSARHGAALGYRVFFAADAVFPPLASYPPISSAQAITTDEALAAPPAATPVATARSALLIVDMQNHFLFPQKGDDEARQKNFTRNSELVRHCAAMAEHLRAKGWPVIWIKTGRRADRVDTAMHKLREDILMSGDNLLLDGAWGAELADGLAPLRRTMCFINGARAASASRRCIAPCAISASIIACSPAARPPDASARPCATGRRSATASASPKTRSIRSARNIWRCWPTMPRCARQRTFSRGLEGRA